MSCEIELKAWVDNVHEVEARLRALACYQFEYTKNDVYWYAARGGNFPSGVRVRRETRVDADGEAQVHVLVTYKTRERRDGLEVNDETEFCVDGESGAAAFERFLQRAGFEGGFCKTKHGKCWLYTAGAHTVNAELSLVEGLGYFLELEILAEDAPAAFVESARAALLDLLARAGIPAGRIENRYYSEMLADKTARGPNDAAGA